MVVVLLLSLLLLVMVGGFGGGFVRASDAVGWSSGFGQVRLTDVSAVKRREQAGGSARSISCSNTVLVQHEEGNLVHTAAKSEGMSTQSPKV